MLLSKSKRGIPFFSIGTVLLLVCFSSVSAQNIPPGLETVVATNGSVWERVSEPGFGDSENVGVVAMKEFQNRLYALVRNDLAGAEVWRSTATGWEQVLFPGGETNGIYGNTMTNSHMGTMIVFNNKLYVGFSSGIQGNYLKSAGSEVWRYDGSTWEPVISDKKDTEETGTITGISGCDDADSEITGFITDASKAWTTDEWAGGILQIISGDGSFRTFDIVSNTGDTLTIQQNEIAANLGSEYTICGSMHYQNPFPPHEYDLGAVLVGDSYAIGTGSDENGFGQTFNKAIANMTIFEDKLYVTTVLNYDYGGQVWYTADGNNWDITDPPRSMGLFHDDPNYPNNQKPVTRGIPSLCVCGVSGDDRLYAGTLGSPGNLGSCARMAYLTDTGWELIVDTSVDANDNGTNENGFGGGLSCTMDDGNFNLWTQACFDGKLFAGFQSLGGSRVMYTPNGSKEDGSWIYSVGGDGSLPAGFDGEINGSPLGLHQTIAVNLFVHDEHLYAGLIRLYMPEFGATEEFLTGSHIWRTRDGDSWEAVTDDGFGDITILTFESFVALDGRLYVAGSRAANTVGGGLGGASIFRLRSDGTTLVTLSDFNATGERGQVILSWETASEVDNTGFNIYRADQADGQYVKINTDLIPAQGSAVQGAMYSHVDADVRNRKTYYYMLEDVDASGVTTWHGPQSATPRWLPKLPIFN